MLCVVSSNTKTTALSHAGLSTSDRSGNKRLTAARCNLAPLRIPNPAPAPAYPSNDSTHTSQVFYAEADKENGLGGGDDFSTCCDCVSGNSSVKLTPEFAIKYPLPTNNSVQQLNNEINVLHQLGSHDNLVCVVDAIPSSTLRMPRYATDLRSQILSQSLSLQQKSQAVHDILTAVNYMHEQGYLHCDIKPSNVLWDEHAQRYRLADFGLARRIDAPTDSSKIYGTVAYLAPEISQVGFSRASDMYAVGCLVRELLYDLPHPFADQLERVQDYAFAFAARQTSPTADLCCSHEHTFVASAACKPFQSVIAQCTARCPSVRPSAQQLLRSDL